jgi:integrase/recombinase XerD
VTAVHVKHAHLAAEGKSGKTVRTYTEAVQWFAAAHLLRETSHRDWDQVGLSGSEGWEIARRAA